MQKNNTDKIINDMLDHTSILKNTLLFKTKIIDEKIEELTSAINSSAKADNPYGGISWTDIHRIYLNSLDKIGIESLRGEERRLEYGTANILSQTSRESIRSKLNTITPKKYTITFSIKNFQGTFDLEDKPLEGATFDHDKANNILKITITTQGYFDFEENNDNKALEYSCLTSATSIFKILFTYLSFFKNTIWVGESFDYDQELVFSIEDTSTSSIKTIQTYKDDAILILYPCHVKYEDREFNKDKINSNFMQILAQQKHLLLAFEWFARSLCANDNDNRIIMLCIAFEALYGKHNTTKEQTKNKDTYMIKAVYFLSETEKERETFSETLLALFKARNTIVHADTNKKSDIQNSRLFYKSKNIFVKTFFKELAIYEKSRAQNYKL